MAGFSIVTNVSSLVAQENLIKTNKLQQRTITRLTSGLRINSSADDAAGLAIANRFRSDIAVLQQGIRNAVDGLSTLQTIYSSYLLQYTIFSITYKNNQTVNIFCVITMSASECRRFSSARSHSREQ